jgi:predicted acyltransferase
LRSLDAFRGATIAGMILVNNPGTWSAIYPPFRHAAWHGWTPTDLIFPYFLFIVGVAVALALGRRLERGVARTALLAKAGRRALILVALGLFMAAWPFLRLSPGLGLRDLSTLRLPGVLQRIGVCYLLAVLAYLWLKPRGRALLGAGLLLGYWAALAWIPVPGGEAGVLEPPAATLAAWVDRALLGDHLWSAANREWDPEGVLSTFPAVVTVLLGIAAGERLRLRGSGRATVRWLVGWGIALTVAGLAWDRVFPINKQLWTSSYVLFSGGTAFLALAAFHAVADLRPAGRGVRALEIYGVNAIAVFVGSGLLAKTLGLIRIPDGGGGTTSLAGAIWTHGFRPLGPPELASLLHAVVWVAGWWLVLWWMARRGIVWKV